MDRINHGVYYKKNIRRETPNSNASICSILKKGSKDNSTIIEEWHEPNESVDMDVDIDIDSDTADELSRRSQPMEVNTDDIFDCFDNDQECQDEIEDTIVNYMNYTSGIPAHRVHAALDLVNNYERLRRKREMANRLRNMDNVHECANNSRMSGMKRPHSNDDDDDQSQCKSPRK